MVDDKDTHTPVDEGLAQEEPDDFEMPQSPPSPGTFTPAPSNSSRPVKRLPPRIRKPQSPAAPVLPESPPFPNLLQTSSGSTSEPPTVRLESAPSDDTKEVPRANILKFVLAGVAAVSLAVAISRTPGDQSSINSAAVAAPQTNNHELAAARSEIEAFQIKLRGLQRQIGEANQQGEVERRNADKQLKTAQSEILALNGRISELLAELDRVKRSQPQPRPTPAAEPRLPAPPRQSTAARDRVMMYRVNGLGYGDFLNVRSGPGAGYPVLIRLQNGVKVLAAGDGVTNEADLWLPCLIDKVFTDPMTGTGQTIKQKGWVHSSFVELVIE